MTLKSRRLKMEGCWEWRVCKGADDKDHDSNHHHHHWLSSTTTATDVLDPIKHVCIRAQWVAGLPLIGLGLL